MQVEPQQAQPVLITAPAGGLSLDPGRQVVARVIEIDSSGGARISLAGATISVSAPNVPLARGDVLNLTVGGVENGRVSLALTSTTPAGQQQAQAAATTPADQLPAPVASRQLAEIAPNAIRELARAGVPVTPQLTQAVSKAVEQLIGPTGQAPTGAPTVETAARAIANLVARDFALNPAAAGRVAAALDLAGRLGQQLGQLVSQSPEIAAALPGGPPGTAALRALVSPQLVPAELAIARIVQAQAAAQSAQASAPGGPINLPTPPSSSPAVIANYVASQVAVTTRLDALAHANTGQGQQTAAQTQLPGTATPTGAPVGAPGNASLAAINQQAAAVRGEGAAPAQGAVRGELPVGAARAAPAAGIAATAGQTTTAAGTSAQQHAAAQRPQAGAAAAAAGGGAPPTTPPQVAQVVADLSIALGRLATSMAPGEGAPGQVNQALARGLASADQQAAAGSFTPQAAGGGSGGAPAPLIAAMRELVLGSQAAEAQQQASRTLVQALSGASHDQVAAALRQLNESHTLQLAGRILDLLPHHAQVGMNPQAANDLRHGIHNILQQLGQALQPGAHDEQAVLRAALEHVAANDPRPAVADHAQRMLHAIDGQQLLSQPRSGADPGYVYFQLPLPGNRAAEVIVRREPGRRAVSFDHFDIAFLLDTESMGSLLIHLDAHPGAVRAMIKTEDPALEPFLAQQAEALREPVEREARRPLIVSTGVFDGGRAPASLLEPQLGMIPGENAYYA